MVIRGSAFGWHDKTHLAISKAAGYDDYYDLASADITKTMANDKEATNRLSNNTNVDEVTAEIVVDQAKRYNDQEDKEGHLYDAIIASLR